MRIIKNNWLVAVVIAVVVAGAAFFGGMKYQQSQAASAYGQGGNGQFARFRNGGGTGRGGFGNAAVGTIVSMDANSITLKLQDGSSKIVNLSSSTTYSKTQTASQSDLTTGTRIAAIGQTASDGSISAQNIQINPQFRGPRPSGMPSQSQ